jgi:hypothetical protein
MNWDELNRDWPSVSEDVNREWGKFTNEDLELISGQRESFVRLFSLR